MAAGCFPLFEEVVPTGGLVEGVEAGLGEDVLYGALGTFSGFKCWI